MAVTPVRYFATAFFSPFYFPPLGLKAGGDPTGIGQTQYGDEQAFEAIVATLKFTGVFADVQFGISLDQSTSSAGVVPLALVTPEYWTELDDGDPSVLLRQVAYSITVIVRDDQPLDRYSSLTKLTAIVQDALNQTDLGGGCLPSLTSIRRGSLKPSSNAPEQSVILDGEFAYLIPSANSHSILNQ